MKRRPLRLGRGFRLAIGHRRAQRAELILAPGKAQRGPRTRTISAAPAYRADGDELPPGRP